MISYVLLRRNFFEFSSINAIIFNVLCYPFVVVLLLSYEIYMLCTLITIQVIQENQHENHSKCACIFYCILFIVYLRQSKNCSYELMYFFLRSGSVCLWSSPLPQVAVGSGGVNESERSAAQYTQLSADLMDQIKDHQYLFFNFLMKCPDMCGTLDALFNLNCRVSSLCFDQGWRVDSGVDTGYFTKCLFCTHSQLTQVCCHFRK